MNFRNTNKLKSFLLKIFTLGNRFSVTDLYDRLKKYAVEGIGIFIVISFSFYVENKGGEYEMTISYLEMLHAFKKDILETKNYADNFLTIKKDEAEAFRDQLDRWNVNNDSVFITSIEDEDGKHFYPPLGYFTNYNPFVPSKRGKKIFEMGGVDFELLNNSISESINYFYDNALYYIVENSTSYEKKYIQDFEDRIVKVWSSDIGNIELTKNQFWIDNRRYIQKDKVLYYLTKFRLGLWDEEMYLLEGIVDNLNSTLEKVETVIQEMEDEVYFVYWKLY